MKRTKAIEKLLSAIDTAKLMAEETRDSLQESFDNKSEKWQEGEKGEEMQAGIDAIEESISNLETAYNDIENTFEE